MVTKNDKEQTVAELKDKFSRAKSVFTTKQLGLTVEEITNLRNDIRELGAEFKIAKNTLFKLASQGTQFEELATELKGPTAFLFCYDDEISPAGKVKSFSGDNGDKVTIDGGFLDGDVLNEEQATKVASLPSKDTLLSQIAGMLVQPTQQIAYIVSQLGENDDKDKPLKELIVVTDSAEASVEEPAQEPAAEEKAAEASNSDNSEAEAKAEEPAAEAEGEKEEG